MRISVEAEVTIGSPPATVFAVVTDVTGQPAWASAVELVTDLSDAPARLGTTWTQVTRLVGRRVEVHARVVGFEQDRRFAYRVDKPAPVVMTWRFAPAPTGTRVAVVAEGNPGLLSALVRPFLGALKEALDADLARLKRRVETGSSPAEAS